MCIFFSDLTCDSCWKYWCRCICSFFSGGTEFNMGLCILRCWLNKCVAFVCMFIIWHDFAGMVNMEHTNQFDMTCPSFQVQSHARIRQHNDCINGPFWWGITLHHHFGDDCNMQSVCSVNFFGCFHTFLKHLVPRWGSASDTVIRVLNEALERKALKALSGNFLVGKDAEGTDLLRIYLIYWKQYPERNPQIGDWEVCKLHLQRFAHGWSGFLWR